MGYSANVKDYTRAALNLIELASSKLVCQTLVQSFILSDLIDRIKRRYLARFLDLRAGFEWLPSSWLPSPVCNDRCYWGDRQARASYQNAV